MRKETYKNYIRVSKKAAEKAYNAGKTVLIAPVNANMDYIFFPGVYINKELDCDISDLYNNNVDNIKQEFNRTVNYFEHYNCNSELGKYSKFFVESEEMPA